MLNRSKYLKRLLILMGLFCLILGALWFYPEPERYQDPQRIQIQRPELPPEENAYLVWARILKDFQQSWTAEEMAGLNQALKYPDNQQGGIEQALSPLMDEEKELSLWHEFLTSLELPGALTPLERPDANMAEPSLDFLFLSRLLEARGKMDVENRNWSGGIEMGFHLIHMGQVFQLSHGASRFYSLGCAIEAYGLYLIQKTIGAAEFNDLELIDSTISRLNENFKVDPVPGSNSATEIWSWRKQACLEALQNEADFLVDLIVNEEWFQDQERSWFQTVAPGMNYFLLFNPAKTGAIIASYRQKLTGFYGRPYMEFGAELNQKAPSMMEIIKTLPSGNVFGVFMGELLTPTMEVILIRDIITKTRLNGIRASLVLKKLYLEEEKAALDDFSMSQFAEKAESRIREAVDLSEPALDHFTGKNLSLEWESENRAVFSSTGRDQANPSDDLKFPVNFPAQPNIAPESGAL